MLGKWVTIVTGLCAGALALGCSASREVEVTGSVSGASAQGDVVLEFFDIDGEEKTSVHTAKAGSDGERTRAMVIAEATATASGA